MMLEPGLVVADRYRLLEELGRGGMGSVWRAYQQAIDSEVAVKFIETEGILDAELRERFQREAKAAARLRSAHVVQVFDHGEWQGKPYIVMELLDGEDLRHRLDRQGKLAPSECVAILRQAARALVRAHEAGIVHRDLKPDNLFLVREGEASVVKVLDFGIAKLGPSILETNQKTQTGALLGTPHYMAPEQARSSRSVDFRTDLWALAVIALESLTGQRPFDGDALGDLLLRIMVDPLPVPTQMAGELPPALDAWWLRAAAREPAQRFGSAKELVDTLADALGVHDHTEVPPPPVSSRLMVSHADIPVRELTVKPVTSDAARERLPSLPTTPPKPGRAAVVIALAAVASLGLLVAVALGVRHLTSLASTPPPAAPAAPLDRESARPAPSPVVSAVPVVSVLPPSPSSPVSAQALEAATPPVSARPLPATPGGISKKGAAPTAPTKPLPTKGGTSFNYGAL